MCSGRHDVRILLYISSDESWTIISLDKANELAKNKSVQLEFLEHVSSTSDEKTMDFGKTEAEHAAVYSVWDTPGRLILWHSIMLS